MTASGKPASPSSPTYVHIELSTGSHILVDHDPEVIAAWVSEAAAGQAPTMRMFPTVGGSTVWVNANSVVSLRLQF